MAFDLKKSPPGYPTAIKAPDGSELEVYLLPPDLDNIAYSIKLHQEASTRGDLDKLAKMEFMDAIVDSYPGTVLVGWRSGDFLVEGESFDYTEQNAELLLQQPWARIAIRDAADALSNRIHAEREESGKKSQPPSGGSSNGDPSSQKSEPAPKRSRRGTRRK